MDQLEEMIVEGIDSGSRQAWQSQICRSLVGKLGALDEAEAALVSKWDVGLSAEDRRGFVDIFWARTKSKNKTASSRAWLFYGLVQDDMMVTGHGAGLLIMFALASGLRDWEVAAAFGIVH